MSHAALVVALSDRVDESPGEERLALAPPDLQEEARHRLELLQSAFFKVTAAGALLRVDAQSHATVVVANQSCAEMFGRSVAQLVDRSLLDEIASFIDADDLARFTSSLREGRAFDMQLGWSPRQNVRDWYVVAASPFHHGELPTMYWLLIFRDTSKSTLRKAVERLRLSAMEMVVQNSPRSAFARQADAFLKSVWPDAVVTWLLMVDGKASILLSDRPSAWQEGLGAKRLSESSRELSESRVPQFDRSPWNVPIVAADGTLLGALIVEVELDESASPIQREILERVAETSARFFERKNDLERIHYLALHDPLTGLPNREFLMRDLGTTIAQHGEQDGFAVVFIDLSRFKSINDTFGHSAGDRVLREVGDRLRRAVRARDVVARVGDDEFVCLLKFLRSPAEMRQRIKRLRTRLILPLTIGESEIRINPSIGIALFPEHSRDPETLLRFSDEAMDAARASTRVVALHDTGRPESRDRSVLIDAALARALDSGELTLRYQPVLDLMNSRVQGYEALLRWHSERFGVVDPDEFIPLAEDSGLIVTIGAWVIETACRQAAELLPEHSTIAVNVSARQLEDPDFLEIVHDALVHSALPPEMLIVEITETTLMRVPDRALATIRELKRLGVSTMIDDFGTGFSSLKVLRNLPVDGLKIDRSFVKDIARDLTPARTARSSRRSSISRRRSAFTSSRRASRRWRNSTSSAASAASPDKATYSARRSRSSC